jgi:hypothetical protein
MADVFLQWKFNISPLLKDIEAVRHSLSEARLAIDKRLKDAGVRRRRDFNATLDDYYRNSDESVGDLSDRNDLHTNTYLKPNKFPFEGLTQSRRVCQYSTKRFHAQVEYSNLWDSWQRENAYLLATLDKLGVMTDPSIVWNAIPWSFVIDWVIDVNQWLDQFAMPNMMPTTVVHRWCWSQHVVRTIIGYCGHGGMDAPGTPTLTATVFTEDAYIRSNSKLNVTSALTGTGISAMEFTLGAALGGSRLRR